MYRLRFKGITEREPETGINLNLIALSLDLKNLAKNYSYQTWPSQLFESLKIKITILKLFPIISLHTLKLSFFSNEKVPLIF